MFDFRLWYIDYQKSYTKDLSHTPLEYARAYVNEYEKADGIIEFGFDENLNKKMLPSVLK